MDDSYGSVMAPTATRSPDPEPPQGGIAEVVGQRVVLRPRGRGHLTGQCPFCQSTAFHVRPSHGTFHCFGCGQGGDARAFNAKMDRR